MHYCENPLQFKRRLSREVELRFRRQLDARTEAAARMADDLRRD